MSSTDIRAKTVWHLLGDQGHKVCVVNVPTEYPPRPVNGSLVCGALTPDTSVDFTYPVELRNEILEAVPDYRCEIDYVHLSLASLSKQITRSIKNRERLIRHLMATKKWDLFFAVFTETDLAQHKFWAGIDPHHPHHRRLARDFGGFVYEIYEMLDGALGRILGDIPENTIVFIVSDHGFGPFYQSFSVAQWLVDHGLLVRSSSWHRRSVKWVMDKTRVTGQVARFREQVDNLRCTVKGRRDVRALRERAAIDSARIVDDVDWRRTKAYFTPDYGIRLNLRGREAEGIVNPGSEQQALMESIMEGLRGLHYSNGCPVFEAVLPCEEAYHGPFSDRAPDIVLPINYSGAPPLPEPWEYTLTHPTLQGTHTPFGIFIAHGPGIKRSQTVENMKIVDVAPTILYVFRESLTIDMDGSVLLDLFEPSFTVGRKIKRQGVSAEKLVGGGQAFQETDNAVKERLRALGYID
jgi:predicted AlkP superfamily phosphohydrolase/phosphomutase